MVFQDAEGVTHMLRRRDQQNDVGLRGLVHVAGGMDAGLDLHADIEHCYVLEGDLHFADGVVMHAGDYAAARQDSDHPVSFTENGCLLLIIASEQNATL